MIHHTTSFRLQASWRHGRAWPLSRPLPRPPPTANRPSTTLRSTWPTAPAGAMLAVSDHTAANVTILNPAGARSSGRSICTGILPAWPGRPTARTFSWPSATPAVLPRSRRPPAQVVRRMATGPRPVGLALAAKKGLLVVADSANDSVLAIDLAAGKEKARVPAVREPYFLAVTPDESLAIVGNLLPVGDASLPTQSAAVTLIDLEKLAPAGEIKLPAGTTNIRKIVAGPEGRWVYVAHTLARFMLPTTQLERGWMNTNAVTILDVVEKKVYCTLLLDLITEGAADPWGLAMTRDGSTLFVSIAGCHQIARLDLAKLHQLLRSDEYIRVARLSESSPPRPKTPTRRVRLRRRPPRRRAWPNSSSTAAPACRMPGWKSVTTRASASC